MTPQEARDLRGSIMVALGAAERSGDENAQLSALQDLEKIDSFIERQSKPAPLPGPSDLAAGVNRGVLRTADTLLGNPGAGLANTFGADIARNPITRTAQELGVGRESQSPAGQFVGRMGEEVGAGLLPGGAVIRGAQPLSKMGGLIGEIGKRAAAAPGSVALADVGSGLAAGAGAATAQRVAPGSLSAEMAGSILGGSLPVGAASKWALGINQGVVDDFARAGSVPTVGQASDRPAVRGIEAIASKAPGGYGPLAGRYAEQAEDIGANAKALARRITPRPDPEVAGRRLRTGADEFVVRSQEKASDLWNGIGLPMKSPTAAPNTRALTTELLGKGVLAPELASPTTRKLVALIQEQGDALTIEDLQGFQRQVGAMIGDYSLTSDIPRGTLKRLYAAATEDLGTEAAKIGARPKWERARRYTKALHDRVDDALDPIVNKKQHLDVFKALVRGSPQQVTSVRRSMKPSQWDAVKGAVVDLMGQAKPGKQASVEADDFSLSTFLTEWAKLKPKSRSQFFAGRYGADIKAIASAAARARQNAEYMSNNSGTARSLMAGGATALGAGSYAVDNTALLAATLTAVGASAITSRMMASPRVVRWLARASTSPVSKLPAMAGRLEQIASSQPEALKADLEAFLAQVKGAF